MAENETNIVLPYQFYNLIMIFVVILTLLWSMRAMKRIYRMLRVRTAILSDRMIQIRGLGSYLSYFEGATQMHTNAIVHTRQTKPPVGMSTLYVPYTVRSTSILRTQATSRLEIEFGLYCSSNSKSMLLFNFKKYKFKKMVSDMKLHSFNLRGNSSLASQIFSSQKTDRISVSSAAYQRQQFQNLINHNCTDQEVILKDIDAGETILRLPIITNDMVDMNASPASRIILAPKHDMVVALILFPNPQQVSGTGRNPMTEAVLGSSTKQIVQSTSPVHQNSNVNRLSSDSLLQNTNSADENAALAGDDRNSSGNHSPAGAAAGDKSAMFRFNWSRKSVNPEAGGLGGSAHGGSSHGGSAHGGAVQQLPSIMACVVMYTLSPDILNGSYAPATAAPNTVAVLPLMPTEVMLLDNDGNLFNSQEIFGLNTAAHTNEGTTSPGNGSEQPRPTVSAPFNNSETGIELKNLAAGDVESGIGEASQANKGICWGGKYPDEECVVCLTEPKEILLLPCRHLCVCTSCLIYIDKCPVCRTAFEEYIQIQSSVTNNVRV